MPDFVIFAVDAPGKAMLRAETRPRHLDYARGLGDRMILGGPMSDEDGVPSGSMIVARFDDLAAARAFADADPYAQAGVFAEIRVSAWRKVLPEAG